jgi:tRNA1Val (adenine37-N6)-methyltransferase
MYTYHYAQPEAYHFSLDSIHLAEFVADRLQSRQDVESLRVLDLCAGCGVIGLELSWYCRALRQFDFMEVQDIYTPYFQQNIMTVNRPELQLRWHLLNYDVLLETHWEARFDLIVSNPPYFQSGHGMYSPSEFKNRCRFFLDSTFEKYIFALSNSLAVGGEAYFLLRPLLQHGVDLFAEMKTLLNETAISAKKISQIRGTDIVLLKKL